MQKFKHGQIVYATYHHTWNVNKPGVAKILYRSNERKFHLFASGEKKLCDWYWIIFENNIIPSLFPETCLQDYDEYAQKMKSFLENNKHRIGEKGFSQESFDSLSKSINIIK